MKNEQQMLEEAYQNISKESLTVEDIDRIEDKWIEQQKKAEAIDEIHRCTRPRNRKTPHEI